MNVSLVTSLLLAVVVMCCHAVVKGPFEPMDFTLEDEATFTAIESFPHLELFKVDSTSYVDNGGLRLAVVSGTHYEMGYSYGMAFGREFQDLYWDQLVSMFGSETEAQTLHSFFHDQWVNWLSDQLPADYQDELKGIIDGSNFVGASMVGVYLPTLLAITNIPGSLKEDMFYLLEDEKNNPMPGKEHLADHAAKMFDKFFPTGNLEGSTLESSFEGFQCTDMAAWGSRVSSEHPLLFARNLDWSTDTAMKNHKLITVWKPTGEIAHATIGFVGIFGSLVGFNSEGFAAGEAGLDVTKVTFQGFQWTLRLRDLLAHATTIDEALTRWEQTNNTMGMNYVLASGSDQEAVALETMKDYTAVFHANDPRETLEYTNPITGTKTQLGHAMPDAVFRSNHAYSLTAVEASTDVTTPATSTYHRYNRIAVALDNYEAAAVEMEPLQMVNVSSVASQHRGLNDYQCPAPGHNKGNNVLSVTYDPAHHTAYVAYESGAKVNNTWTNASCGTYLKVDLSSFLE